jgi:ribulose 1,5-bisphosphate synthetase/thiazole synthase
MNINHSPWIQQLKRTRPLDQINKNTDADVVIVGGGIAGVSTAYFILKNTNRKVGDLINLKIEKDISESLNSKIKKIT